MPGAEPPTNNEPSPQKTNFWVQAGRISQLAFVMPAATVIGWLIGGALDHWLHTTWLNVLGLIVGAAAGLVDLVRTAITSSK